MGALDERGQPVPPVGVDAPAPKCPECHCELALLGAGRLDQSGNTSLPARRWCCESEPCQAREILVTLPTGERWRGET